MGVKKSVTQTLLYVIIITASSCVGFKGKDSPVEELFPTNIIRGITENGTSYYIKPRKFDEHSNESNIVKIYFLVKAGSINEDDNQLGLAHFVEHMAFNGSEKFPQNAIIVEAEKRGIRFGPDINATTTFNYTKFKIHVPNSLENIIFALDVIKEWARNLSYDEEAIEKEKPVVIEEVRAQQSKEYQENENDIKFLLGDSKYSQRLPSGKMDVIAEAPREVIKKFYDDWYTPNLMGIIIEGDVDSDFIIEEINARFSYEDSHAISPHITIPLGSPNTLVVRKVETPMRNNTLTIQYITPRKKASLIREVADEILTTEFIPKIWNTYFNILVEQGKIISATVNITPMAAEYLWHFDFHLIENKYKDGIKAIFQTFSALMHNEVDTQLLSGLLEWYVDDVGDGNIAFSPSMEHAFVLDTFVIGADYKKSMMKQVKKILTPQGIRERINDILTQSEMKMIASAPREKIIPSDDVINTLYQDVMLPPTSALNEIINNDDEIRDKITQHIRAIVKNVSPGTIVSQESLPEYPHTHRFELSNGIAVEYNQSSAYEDYMGMVIHGLGGNRYYLAEDTLSDYVIAYYYQYFMDAIQLAKLSKKEMKIFQDTHNMSSWFSLVSNHQNLYITGNKNFLKAFFQLPYLYFTSINFNALQVAPIISAITHKRNAIENISSTYFFEKINTFYVEDPYSSKFDTHFDYVLKKEDVQRAFEVYQNIISTPQNFTFSIQGNIPVEKIIPYIEYYIASIPTNRSQPISPSTTSLTHGFDIAHTHENTAQSLVFAGWNTLLPPKNIDIRDMLLIYYLHSLIDNRLTDTIREKEAGVYVIRPLISYEAEPLNAYEAKDTKDSIRMFLAFMFGSDPARAQELKEKSIEAIEDLRDNPIPPELALRTRAEVIRWIQDKEFYPYFEKISLYLKRKMLRVSRENIRDDFHKALDTITIEDVQAFLAAVIQGATPVHYVLNPPDSIHDE